MGTARLACSVLSILIAITGLSLAALMLRAGHVSGWFAPIMLAWNLGPLIAMRILAARKDRWSPASIPLVLGLLYVAALCWGYYDAFYPAPSSSAGFAYLLLPLLGWFGLALDQIIDTGIAIRRAMTRR